MHEYQHNVSLMSSLARLLHHLEPETENSASILLKLPLAVVQGAYLPRLQPSADAMEMEGVVANTWWITHRNRNQEQISL